MTELNSIPRSYRPENTAAVTTTTIPQLSGAWEEVPTKPHSNREPRIQMVWMILDFVTYCAVSKFDVHVKAQTGLQNTPHDKCG